MRALKLDGQPIPGPVQDRAPRTTHIGSLVGELDWRQAMAYEAQEAFTTFGISAAQLAQAFEVLGRALSQVDPRDLRR